MESILKAAFTPVISEYLRRALRRLCSRVKHIYECLVIRTSLLQGTLRAARLMSGRSGGPAQGRYAAVAKWGRGRRACGSPHRLKGLREFGHAAQRGMLRCRVFSAACRLACLGCVTGACVVAAGALVASPGRVPGRQHQRPSPPRSDAGNLSARMLRVVSNLQATYLWPVDCMLGQMSPRKKCFRSISIDHIYFKGTWSGSPWWGRRCCRRRPDGGNGGNLRRPAGKQQRGALVALLHFLGPRRLLRRAGGLLGQGAHPTPRAPQNECAVESP